MNRLEQPVRRDLPAIGVVGAGTMGKGIAQVAAAAGYPVRLYDAGQGYARMAVDSTRDVWAARAGAGKMSPGAVEAATRALNPVERLEELAGCAIVIEAIREDLESKRSLFSSLEKIAGPDCILATNTSSLLVSAIAAGCEQPGRVVGAHFFNPVPAMKVVEVIPGLLTEERVVEAMRAFVETLGHSSVIAADSPGFLINHAGRGLYTEGLRIVSEGIATPHEVDRVMREAAGFRMGPFELFDLTGLDVSFPVLLQIYEGFFQEDRFRPAPLLRRQVESGRYGRKTGQGFYAYDKGRAVPVEPRAPARWQEMPVWLSPADRSQHAWLVERLASFGIVADTGEKPASGSIIIVLPLGDDATTTAAAMGYDVERVIAIDPIFPDVGHLTLMPAVAVPAAGRDSLHGMILAGGGRATVVRDSPGFIVQRVLAMIVNIACDIAQQRIASAHDIDFAVRIGLGYPAGPLTLGDTIGARQVLAILDRMSAFYGDPRYRPSPWLKRRAIAGLSLLHADV